MLKLDLGGIPEELRLGTSSFSTADWRGVFYPADLAPSEFLRFYATQLRTVEIDATFYATPSRRTVDGWAGKVPDGFLISAKVPKSITHDAYLDGCDGEWEEFLEAIDRLGDKCGPLLLQFPYVSKAANPAEYRTGDDFRRRLERFLPLPRRDHRLVVEIRNERWIAPPLLDLLRAHAVALALTVYYTMPSPARLYERLDVMTADFAYFRFLGDHRRMDRDVGEAIASGRRGREWESVLVDREREIAEVIPVVRDIIARRMNVFAYFNNHYAGFAPGSIDQFARIWRESAGQRAMFPRAPRPAAS
jgi:uncharacterized protein YecE (DUF72 family)